MKAYKGFDKDLKCGDFQYEVGGRYEEAGAELRNRSFYAWENPLDIFKYYPPAHGRYCEVELDEVSDVTSAGDSKRVGRKIHVVREIGLSEIIEAGVDFIFGHIDWDQSAASNTGDQSAAANAGEWSAATNTGNWSAATNTGQWSAATNTGDWSAATNTGDQSAATNTGYQSAATNTGEWSAATNTGELSAATNTGYQSAATNTGYQSAATNTGDWSTAANTGDESAATNTGDWSTAANTGDESTAKVSGKESIAIVTGRNSKAAGSLGCWLVLTEREDNRHICSVQAAFVDGEKIKPDTFYKIKNGKIIEAKD
nr:MAG TPA: hypothetical protein [Caudoviricetes sp.]